MLKRKMTKEDKGMKLTQVIREILQILSGKYANLLSERKWLNSYTTEQSHKAKLKRIKQYERDIKKYEIKIRKLIRDLEYLFKE